MKIALIGNQNSGKTTLFNELTGSNQHVGNFPGVTVEQKHGYVRNRQHEIEIIDLPGIYSLSPFSSDEIVTRDILLSGEIDGIINIVDATNIERNLYLTMQLLTLQIPTVIALNMMDEMKNNHSSVDVKGIEKELTVPVIPISAAKKEGIEDLILAVIDIVENKKIPASIDWCQGAVHRTLHSVLYLIEDHAQAIHIPPRFVATKLIEGDDVMLKKLNLTPNEQETIEHSVQQMVDESGYDRYAAIATMRYTYIEKIVQHYVKKENEMSIERKRSVKIDRILTHKYLGLPLFFAIMMVIFYLTFDLVGSFLSDLLVSGIDGLTSLVAQAMSSSGINPVIQSLVIDGIFAGVGSVISFIPIIVTLFLFLSLLEDSGYMTRVAFIMDKLLRKIGLSGKSFVPMLIGFGCSVPAIMATRTLNSERDRKMTIFLTPFMSCSAKLPIYAVFTYAFFAKHRALMMILLYVIGIIVGIISAYVMNKTRFKGKPIPFIMELPNYRFPSLKTTLLLLWDKARDFLVRAFTIIFLASLVIWFLSSFDFKFNPVTNIDTSILATIAQFITPLFKPLGFGDWKIVTALIAGFSAKEAVVSILAVLLGTNMSDLFLSLPTLFTPLSAFAFLLFTLLYTPCVAAVATMKRELKSGRLAFVVVLIQTAMAYVIALLVYQIGGLF